MKKILFLMASVAVIALFAGGAVSAEHTTSTELMNTDDMQQENTVKQKEKAEKVAKKKQKAKKSYQKKGAPAIASLNINTASQKELAKLPGIGTAKAQAIIDGRPYKTKEDLMKVKGIKKGAFNKIKDMIVI